MREPLVGREQQQDHLKRLIGQALDTIPGADVSDVVAYCVGRDPYVVPAPVGVNPILHATKAVIQSLREDFGREVRQPVDTELTALLKEAAYLLEKYPPDHPQWDNFRNGRKTLQDWLPDDFDADGEPPDDNDWDYEDDEDEDDLDLPIRQEERQWPT
jgi:hypothetical protein